MPLRRRRCVAKPRVAAIAATLGNRPESLLRRRRCVSPPTQRLRRRPRYMLRSPRVAAVAATLGFETERLRRTRPQWPRTLREKQRKNRSRRCPAGLRTAHRYHHQFATAPALLSAGVHDTPCESWVVQPFRWLDRAATRSLSCRRRLRVGGRGLSRSCAPSGNAVNDFCVVFHGEFSATEALYAEGVRSQSPELPRQRLLWVIGGCDRNYAAGVASPI